MRIMPLHDAETGCIIGRVIYFGIQPKPLPDEWQIAPDGTMHPCEETAPVQSR